MFYFPAWNLIVIELFLEDTFLDVCVTREASGGLMTKIYKKPNAH